MMTTLAIALTPLLDQERRILEPLLRLDVGRDHRLSRLEGVSLRAAVRRLDAHLAHDAGLPAHACAHQQGMPVLLQLHDLGEVGAQPSPTRRQASVKISSRSSDFRASSPNLARTVCCRSNSRLSLFSASLKRHAPHRIQGLWAGQGDDLALRRGGPSGTWHARHPSCTETASPRHPRWLSAGALEPNTSAQLCPVRRVKVGATHSGSASPGLAHRPARASHGCGWVPVAETHPLA